MSLAAQITSTGIIAPDYADILAQLKFAYRSIYGQDAYLEDDSQDGQLLAVFAQAINACNQTAVAVYNAYAPGFAQGAGLSSVVKINGLRRLISSLSSVDVVVGGQVGTIINNGVIGDDLDLGTQWALPPTVTIPIEGEITVTAVALTPGATMAGANTLTKILTPSLGWQTVNNPSAASPGNPIESDATLRERQAASTALPALSVFEAILAVVANLQSVSRYTGYENNTGVPDDNGIPGHSISLVVQGGDVQEIAAAIANKITPGTGTYGTTEVTVLDPRGIPNTIRFFVLSEVALTVDVKIKPLVGYVSTTGDAIIAAVAEYINTLDIGELSYTSRLYGPANLSGDAATSATGMTQAQLDVLARTYAIIEITQSRLVNIPDTTVTDGPYAAGSVLVTMTSVADLYEGQTIAIRLDNAALHQVVISDITDEDVTFAPAVPGGRSILDGANVYLISDVEIAFNEAATAAANNITVTVDA